MTVVNGRREGRADTLRVSEIFHSIQGESLSVGFPTVFVRLTGCPLRCGYCDTAYAFQGGDVRSLDEILQAVQNFQARHVCVTGGEPLAQANCPRLLALLCDAGLAVSLETSGALDIAGVDPRVTIVMDVKTPGSGEEARNRWENLAHLKPGDQVKLVITGRTDYEWARACVADRDLAEVATVLFSPTWGVVDARQLAEWILADGLPVCLQVQLHKYLWGDARGH